MSITESQRAAFLERIDRETGIFFLSLSQDMQDFILENELEKAAREPDPNVRLYRIQSNLAPAYLESPQTDEPYVYPERSFPEED